MDIPVCVQLLQAVFGSGETNLVVSGDNDQK